MLLGSGDGTFQPQSAAVTAVGASPNGIVAGDFTGDGRTDLAVVNEYGSSVSVLLGNGDGTFGPQVTYAVGRYPMGIVAGDFNGDGRIDLAVVNYEDYDVSVLLGNGDGTFQPQVTYFLGGEPSWAIADGDFMGDGRDDLAVVSQGSGYVDILLSNSDGTFQPPVSYDLGPNSPYAIVAGDLTGNGRIDLAVANGGDGTVSVLLGNGDGTFQPPVIYQVGHSPVALVAGDFTGDGRLDLAVAGSYYNSATSSEVGVVSVLLGNGDGTFQPPVNYAVEAQPDSIVAGDFTGNGRIDLAVANYGGNTVSVLLGNVDGTFQPPVPYVIASGISVIATADFTGSGRFDVAGASSNSNAVSLLLSDADGTFVSSSQLPINPHAAPLVADVSGDGTDDVLVVDGSGNIIYRQAIPGQPGSFLPPVTVNPGYPSRDITWLPDTKIGPVLASVDAEDNAISFYAYRDGGFVRLDGSLSTGQLPAQIIAAQLDGNGLDDLVVRNAGDGTLSVYLGSSQQRGSRPHGHARSPELHGGLHPTGRPGRLRRPGGRHHGERPARPGRHQRADRTGERLRNLGGGLFAAPETYRAGTGLYAVDTSGGSPVVTSLDATSAVAAGSFLSRRSRPAW